MRIKDWKLFEGYYQDSINRLNSIKKEIIDIEANYLAEVKNCLWDLIDDFGAEFIPLDEEDKDKDNPLCVDFEILITIDKLGSLLDTLVECNSKCETHIGKGIDLSWIGMVSKENYYYKLDKFCKLVDEQKSFIDKVEYIRNNIERYYMDDTKGINIIMTV